MTEPQHFGRDGFPGVAHKGLRENCTHPDCTWPQEGYRGTGTNAGVEWTGEIVDLSGSLPVIRSDDGAERTVVNLRQPDRGVYCRHGRQVLREVPAEHTCEPSEPPCTLSREDPFHRCPDSSCVACHPEYRIVRPWPCGADGCTQAEFEAAMAIEADEYWEGINDLLRHQYD